MSKVKSRLKSLLSIGAAIILLPAVVMLSIYSLDQQGFFKIDDIGINVSVKTSQKVFVKPYVEALDAKLSAFKGQSLWKFSLSNASEILKKEAWISEFRISRSWPSGLEIEIEPHTVAFLIQAHDARGATEFFPVTEQAQVLRRIDSKQAPNVAVVRQGEFLKNEKIRSGAINILNSLPSGTKLNANSVAEVGYDRKDGYWITLMKSDTKIKFGEDQFELKSNRVSQVIDYLENRELKARVIDANLSKKVLVRMH